MSRAAGAHTQSAITAAILALGLARRAEGGSIIAAVTRIGAIALLAAGAGALFAALPFAGAVVFVAAIASSVWLRNFGAFARSAGSLIALPLVALLIVPLVPDPALSRVANVALAVGAGIVPLVVVTFVRAVATRCGPRTAWSPQSRMAVQMAAALSAAFAAGFIAFPGHWGWTVLTAFIVSSGAIGRGDTVVKAVLRLGGAIAGTAVAALVSLAHVPGGPAEAALVFAVLYAGLRLRDVNYAYWACSTTLILALLSPSNEPVIGGLLMVRLEAMLAGAACAVAAAWFVLPIRTVAIVRRRLADVLLGFDAVFACAPDDVAERAIRHASFEQQLTALERVATPVRCTGGPSRRQGTQITQRLGSISRMRCANTLRPRRPATARPCAEQSGVLAAPLRRTAPMVPHRTSRRSERRWPDCTTHSRAALRRQSRLSRSSKRTAMPTPAPGRDTRQKRAIRDVLERAARPLTTDEILENAKATIAGLGIATVYRSIRSLVDDGFLEVVDLPGRVPVYERAGKGHHHHFLCTQCERVYEIDGCTTEIKGALPRGFTATGHEVTIYGACQTCGHEGRAAQTAAGKKR